MTCFDFSRDGSRLLVGCDDGSIYIVDVDRLFVPHGMRAGIFEITDVDTGEKILYDAENAVILGEDDIVIRKTAHNIELCMGYSYSISQYYSHVGEVQLGYINDRLVQKFYFGVLLGAQLAWANEKYPYLYAVDDTLIQSPMLSGFELILMLGKGWHPFQNDVELFAEALFGGGVKLLTSKTIGTGDPNTTLFGGGKFGFRLDGFAIYISAAYDSIYSAKFGAGISFKLRVAPRIKYSTTEEEE